MKSDVRLQCVELRLQRKISQRQILNSWSTNPHSVLVRNLANTRTAEPSRCGRQEQSTQSRTTAALTQLGFQNGWRADSTGAAGTAAHRWGPVCVCVFRMLQHTHRREHKHTHLSSSQCLLEYIPLGIEGGGVGGVGGLKLLPAALALIPPGKVQSLP